MYFTLSASLEIALFTVLRRNLDGFDVHTIRAWPFYMLTVVQIKQWDQIIWLLLRFY